MNYQNMPLPELEKQKVALLERIQGEHPEGSAIRTELENVENWIKLRNQEQELKASKSASKNNRFRVGS